jgi:hypothetical protein
MTSDEDRRKFHSETIEEGEKAFYASLGVK